MTLREVGQSGPDCRVRNRKVEIFMALGRCFRAGCSVSLGVASFAKWELVPTAALAMLPYHRSPLRGLMMSQHNKLTRGGNRLGRF